MASLAEELESKKFELESLKKSFDEYMESSSQLERELEDSLAESEAKYSDMAKKKALSDEKLTAAQDKFSQAMKEMAVIQRDFASAKDRLAKIDIEKRELESSNEDLVGKVRILESTEEDLLHKLHKAEEEIIFLQTDLESLQAERIESERRLKGELTDIQAELAKVEIADSSASRPDEEVRGSGGEDEPDDEMVNRYSETSKTERELAERDELIDELELELEELKDKLGAAEEQNQQLNEEVERLADELIKIHEKHSVPAETQPIQSNEVEELTLANQELASKLAEVTEKLGATEAALAALDQVLDGERETKDQWVAKHQALEARTVQQTQLIDEHMLTIEKLGQDFSSKAAEALELASTLTTEREAAAQAATVAASDLAAAWAAAAAAAAKPPVVAATEAPLASPRDAEVAVDAALAALRADHEAEMLRLHANFQQQLQQLQQQEARVGEREARLESALEALRAQASEAADAMAAKARAHAAEVTLVLAERDQLRQQVLDLTAAATAAAAASSGAPPGGPLPPSNQAPSPSPSPSTTSTPQSKVVGGGRRSSGGGEMGGNIASPPTVRGSSLSPVGTIGSSPWQGNLAMGPSKALSVPVTITAEGFVSGARRAAVDAIGSGDLERIGSELLSQVDQIDAMRAANARLLQTVQSARGNIQVCCRTRPPNDAELAHKLGQRLSIEVVDDNEIVCFDRRAEAWRSFTYDKVWRADASQADVFADVEPLVLSVVDGYNTCLFAYGQTGSGKTFTMNGYGTDFGVSYRTLNRIFEVLEMKKAQAQAQAGKVRPSKVAHRLSSTLASIETGELAFGVPSGVSGDTESSATGTEDEAKGNKDEADDEALLPFSYSVEVSMLEIYNDQINDLLLEQVAPGVRGYGAGLEIRQGQDGAVGVPGLRQIKVESLEDVMEVFGRGSANRATGVTNLNEHSSRSHLILQVDVTTISNGESPVRSKLHLVDLAGSERVGKSGVTGAAMREAQYINKSLSALGDVMEALDQKSKHIPYRNSKLTYLLQDSLGGNSRTMMIVTACPTELTSEESLITLQFASRVRNVNIGAARRNVNAKNLEEGIKILKAELKEAKKMRTQLEGSLAEAKKELKKATERNAAVSDTRARTADDARKGTDSQIAQLSKANQDLTTRLQDEKEARAQVANELDALQKTFRRANDQLKEVTKERERMILAMRQKEKEMMSLKMRKAAVAEAMATQQQGPGQGEALAITNPRLTARYSSTLAAPMSRLAKRHSLLGPAPKVSSTVSQSPSPKSPTSNRTRSRSGDDAASQRDSLSLIDLTGATESNEANQESKRRGSQFSVTAVYTGDDEPDREEGGHRERESSFNPMLEKKKKVPESGEEGEGLVPLVSERSFTADSDTEGDAGGADGADADDDDMSFGVQAVVEGEVEMVATGAGGPGSTAGSQRSSPSTSTSMSAPSSSRSSASRVASSTTNTKDKEATTRAKANSVGIPNGRSSAQAGSGSGAMSTSRAAMKAPSSSSSSSSSSLASSRNAVGSSDNLTSITSATTSTPTGRLSVGGSKLAVPSSVSKRLSLSDDTSGNGSGGGGAGAGAGGPSRSSIAARSKEALQRHQERMEKRRQEKAAAEANPPTFTR